MTYQDFKNAVLGNGFDIDGYYGAQCWDGYAYYCKFLGVPYANCTTSGYVKDIWENRHTNGILDYFDEVSVMQEGDIAVFREVAGVTPVSHIAIFDSDIDGVNGYFLGQNQDGAPYPSGGKVFNLTVLPYSATFDTAFRPKQKASKSVTKKGVGGGLNKNDYFIDISAYQNGNAANYSSQSKNTVIKTTEGTGWVSPVANQQAQTSNVIAFYHFARFGGNVAQAQAEANFFIANVPKKVKYLVLDYEDDASSDKQANTNAVIAFMEVIKKAGYEPIFYSYVPYTGSYVAIDQVVSKFPKSLWFAGYAYGYNVHPSFDDGDLSVFKQNLANAGISFAFEHTRWYQFTSTAIQGGLDKNIVLISDNYTVEDILQGANEMTFTISAKSGKLPYAVVTNGAFIPVAHIETIQAFQKAGAQDVKVPDDDYNRLLQAINNKPITDEIKKLKTK